MGVGRLEVRDLKTVKTHIVEGSKQVKQNKVQAKANHWLLKYFQCTLAWVGEIYEKDVKLI